MVGDGAFPLESLGQHRWVMDNDDAFPAALWQPQSIPRPLLIYGPQPSVAPIDPAADSLATFDVLAIDQVFSQNAESMRPVDDLLPSNIDEIDDRSSQSDRTVDQLTINERLAVLARHLVDSGAQFFGAHWCGYCQLQRAMFGDAGLELPYIEVANADGTPNEIAVAQGIDAYPTWRFPGSFADHESLFRRETDQLGEPYDSSRIIQRADGFDVQGVLYPEQLAALIGLNTVPRPISLDSDDLGADTEDEPSENPYRNPDNTFDVNNSGSVTALDALNIINELSRGGQRVLPTEGPEVTGIKFVDVTGDGTISALDALRVINQLARNEESPFTITGPAGPLASLGDQYGPQPSVAPIDPAADSLATFDVLAIDQVFSQNAESMRPVDDLLPSNIDEIDDRSSQSDRTVDQLTINERLAVLARHLVDSGAQFFGAHWCGYCQLQRAMFGDAGLELPYIEVANADGTPNEIAVAQGIDAYPTWRFPGSFADHESLFRRETDQLGEPYDSSRIIQRADGFDVQGVLYPEQLAALIGLNTVPRPISLDSDDLGADTEDEPSENPYRNPDNTFDVNNSGSVTALDALNIINELSRGGQRVLPTEGPEVTGIKFVDVTGDGTISALDALRVINQLARNEESPFTITGPAGPLASLGDQVVTWSAAPLVGTVTYDVFLSSAKTCQPENSLAQRTNISDTQMPMFTEVSIDGTYFICLRARNEDDTRLSPLNQGLEIVIALERFHTAFLSKNYVRIPNGPIIPGSSSNLKHFDLKCTEFAATAGLIKDWDGESVVYKAIMSDDFEDARTRINVQGQVRDTKGNLVAMDDNDLWKGDIRSPITLDEYKVFDLFPSSLVYSGTYRDGRRVLNINCENWTRKSRDLGGVVGRIADKSYKWIAAFALICLETLRVYCISPLQHH
jgi:thiol-disulfide isomerase/thioredoxin